MIDLKNPIWKQYIKEIGATSTNSSSPNRRKLVESQEKVIDFDRLKKGYARKHRFRKMPCSCDALFIGMDGSETLIEFKDVQLTPRDSDSHLKIFKKIYDSILIICEIENKDISHMRDSMNFVLVYQKDERKNRNEIAKKVAAKANCEFVLYGLDRFEGFCFERVQTLSPNEFESQFLSIKKSAL